MKDPSVTTYKEIKVLGVENFHLDDIHFSNDLFPSSFKSETIYIYKVSYLFSEDNKRRPLWFKNLKITRDNI